MWQVREVCERAIANIPPAPQKRYWQRYIYLWINYALWEELEAEDPERTREVYKACLDLIPHKAFTFAKVKMSAWRVQGLSVPYLTLKQSRSFDWLDQFSTEKLDDHKTCRTFCKCRKLAA